MLSSKARGIATMLLEHNIPAMFLEKLDDAFFNEKQIIVTPGNITEGFEYEEYFDLGRY